MFFVVVFLLLEGVDFLTRVLLGTMFANQFENCNRVKPSDWLLES